MREDRDHTLTGIKAPCPFCKPGIDQRSHTEFSIAPRINPFRSLAADNNDEYYHCHSGMVQKNNSFSLKDSHDLTLNGIKLKAGYPEHVQGIS